MTDLGTTNGSEVMRAATTSAGRERGLPNTGECEPAFAQSPHEISSVSSRVKLLLVDDLEENLIALEALLQRDGLEVVTARSGEQALELLLVNDVALAFVDVCMPGMDGFELAELMRGSERTRHVPIIFVTAGPRDQHRLFKGYETGAVDFLYKPLDPNILRHKADSFIQLYRQKQQLADQFRELQASARERERLLRELTETLRLAEMFTAVLGHDLRSPLTAMTMGAELLASQTADRGVQKQARRLVTTGRRMERMVAELLDLSRARLADGIPVSRAPLDLRRVCEKVVGEQRLTNPEPGIEVQHRGDTNGVWDEDRLAQLLSNLLGNASRHGDEKRTIEVELDGTRADAVMLQVRNGGTIPSEIIPRLFDPFQVGREKRERPSGLGLGLFIVQQIAHAHGGTVKVESSEGRDTTTFVVTLPR